MNIFHLVLSGYAKLSHNFTNFNFCDVTLIFAVEWTTDSSVWQNNSIFFEVFFEDIVQHLQSKRQSQFCQAKGQPQISYTHVVQFVKLSFSTQNL